MFTYNFSLFIDSIKISVYHSNRLFSDYTGSMGLNGVRSYPLGGEDLY